MLANTLAQWQDIGQAALQHLGMAPVATALRP